MINDIISAIQTLSQRLAIQEARPYNPYLADADMFDHFAGDGTIDARWTTTLTGTGTIQLPNATPSYVRIASGATGASTARLDWGARLPLVGMAKSCDLRWRARIPTAIDANASCNGFLAQSTAFTRFLALGVSGTNSTAFFTARTEGSTGTQATVTTVAVDTAWHDWRIQSMPDRTRFFIDNVQVAEHTLTADTLQTDPLMPIFRAINGATAADRQLDVDLFWVRESR